MSQNFKTATDLDRVNWPFVAEIHETTVESKRSDVKQYRTAFYAVLAKHDGDEVFRGQPVAAKAPLIKTLSRWFPGVRIKEKIKSKLC
jgi:hypothetical protein